MQLKKLVSAIAISLSLSTTSYLVHAADKKTDEYKVESVRVTALKEHAFAKGLAEGRMDKFNELRRTVLGFKELNDQAFNVGHLYSHVSSDNSEDSMLQPPIILVGEDMLQVNPTGKNYTHAEVKYETLAPARFVSSQLNWATFLINDEDLVYAGPADDPLLSPRDEDERKLMAKMHAVSYKEGKDQAFKEYLARVETLTTLITGMYNYHILRTKNLIDPPQISRGYVPVSGNSTQLMLSNRQSNINQDAAFNLNPSNYRAFIERE